MQTKSKQYMFLRETGPIEEGDDLGPKGHEVFSAAEQFAIETEDIDIVLVDASLHSDDTIGVIKGKIVKYLKLERASGELYLFGIEEEKVFPSEIYDQLTQLDTLDLTQERLCQYLLNIIPCGCSELKANGKCDNFLSEGKENYTYDDILSLEGIDWSEPLTYTIPVGQRMVAKQQYPFVANPYNCVIMDDVIKRRASTLITTKNQSLLFDAGTLCNNNLFLCLAEEVLLYARGINGLTETNFIEVYFPHLATEHHIVDLAQLTGARLKMYLSEKKKLGKAFTNYNDKVDLFYNMFRMKKRELDYTGSSPGVTALTFTIHPQYRMQFPLETLFRLIHSDIHIPMIKYNPGLNRENIYRFFTAGKVATNGKKIPYLYSMYDNRKGHIIQLSKRMARRKRVAFYIRVEHEGRNYEIYASFTAGGSIHIHLDNEEPADIATLEKVIRLGLNELILQKIKTYLEQSGYNYILFQNLKDTNIEINDLSYVSSLEIKKNIHLKRFLGCLSSVF